MIGRGALVVVVDAVDREVIVRVATDVVMQERVTRRVVLRESLRLLSVVGLAEVAGTLRLYLKMDYCFPPIRLRLLLATNINWGRDNRKLAAMQIQAR
jgi:hypothetical protein